MYKLTFRLVIALLTFFLGIAATMALLINRLSTGNVLQRESGAPIVQERQALHLMIPDTELEPLVFRAINKRTNESGVPSLRTVLLPDDDLEVRVWVGFGVYGEDALILRRSANQWSAIHLHGMSERPPFPNSQETLAAPRSGWEGAWQRLIAAGILTLPDAAAVGCNTYVNDGTSYVVEINKNRIYRTYLYDNPKYARCNEARQMIEIGEIIAEEFGLEEFRIRD